MDFIKKNTLQVDLSLFQDTDELRISIVVGEGQYGNSAFKNFNGQYETGTILNRILGTPASIKGKSLGIITTVTDTNPDTNRTNVSYQLNGVEVGNLAYETEHESGSIAYLTNLQFS